MQQQVTEIGGVEGLQAVLVFAVEIDQASTRHIAGVGSRDLFRGQGAVFPALDHAHQDARRPALVVDILGRQELFEQAHLVIGVEDREIALQADEFRVASYDPGPERMERPEPDRLGGTADQAADPLAHFARRPVGKGNREHLIGPRMAASQQMRQARRQNARLAGSGTREDQHRPVERLDGLALRAVELRQIGRGRCFCDC